LSAPDSGAFTRLGPAFDIPAPLPETLTVINRMTDDQYQTFWRRLGAAFLDIIIFVSLSLVDDWVLSLQPPVPIVTTYMAVSESTFLVYSILMHGLFGQTVGKMITRVKVVSLDETPLTMRQAVLRDSPGLLFQLAYLPLAVMHLDWLIALRRGDETEIPQWFHVLGYGALLMLFIELATMLTNRKRRALHDFIAGSVVVKIYNQPMERAA
jgi:uncharacterized RDD family membrane protein YckC